MVQFIWRSMNAGRASNLCRVVRAVHPSVRAVHPSVRAVHPSVRTAHPSVRAVHPSVRAVHPCTRSPYTDWISERRLGRPGYWAQPCSFSTAVKVEPSRDVIHKKQSFCQS